MQLAIVKDEKGLDESNKIEAQIDDPTGLSEGNMSPGCVGFICFNTGLTPSSAARDGIARGDSIYPLLEFLLFLPNSCLMVFYKQQT